MCSAARAFFTGLGWICVNTLSSKFDRLVVGCDYDGGIILSHDHSFHALARRGAVAPQLDDAVEAKI